MVKQTPDAVVRIKDIARVELTGQDYTIEFLSRSRTRGRASRCSSAPARTRSPPRNAVRGTTADPRPGISRPASPTRSSTIRPQFISAVGRRGDRDDLEGDRSGRAGGACCSCRPGGRPIIPIVAIPISLIGTFFCHGRCSASRSTTCRCSALVLAIGIVVDDAIVVVENVERNIAAGLSPHDAAVRSMDEVGAALVAIALVLCAVFVPSGIHHRHFRPVLPPVRTDHRGRDRDLADRVADLSPALCALLLQAARSAAPSIRWWERPIRGFFRPVQPRLRRDSPTATAGSPDGSCALRRVMAVVYVGDPRRSALNMFRKTPSGSFRSWTAAI